MVNIIQHPTFQGLGWPNKGCWYVYRVIYGDHALPASFVLVSDCRVVVGLCKVIPSFASRTASSGISRMASCSGLESGYCFVAKMP